MIFKLYLLLRDFMGIKNHDMLWRHNHFIYIDYYGQIWQVIPTHRNDIPLEIRLLKR